MKRSAAEIIREYGPFAGADKVNGVTFDGQHVWFASGDRLNAFDPESRRGRALHRCRRACRHGVRRRAPVPDRRRSHPQDRSENRPCARHDPGPWRRRGLRPCLGRRDALGGAVSRPGKSIRSIPRQGRSFAPSSAAASSPGSAGSMTSSGTAPGTVTRAMCGASTRNGKGPGEDRDAVRNGRVGARVPMAAISFFCGGGNSGKVRAIRRPG